MARLLPVESTLLLIGPTIMSDARYLVRVPVDMLRPGLYVAELDRPWNEVPVKFQGFEIGDDDELRILQQHCRYVFVEEQRCRPSAYTALAVEFATLGGYLAPGPVELPGADEVERHPSKHSFAQRAQQALPDREQALQYLERALVDVRLGRAMTWQEARPLVRNIAEQVAHNTSAVLWLTKLAQADCQAAAHAVNVCVFATLFGLYLGLSEEQIEHIGIGALLHDIGKAQLPPEILDKPGPLSPDEWKVVKHHPVEGVELAFEDRSMPREVREIILMHHERIDGKGYPWGLGPKNIPDHVRVVWLANTYDSLTSERVYRAALPPDEALQAMYNDRDNSVGAELVQAFIHCLGIFPIGTVVELNNGALGVVIDSPLDNRLKPTVLMIRTPGGEFYQKRLLLNLAAFPESASGTPSLFIRRAVNPVNYDIDVASIIAFEFGIDLPAAARGRGPGTRDFATHRRVG